jgi:predicted DNA-binding transcriptional regulator AlpA
MDRLLSFKDLVALGVVGNRVTLGRWIRRCGFPSGTLLGPNSRRWSEAEVKAWIEARRAKAPNLSGKPAATA